MRNGVRLVWVFVMLWLGVSTPTKAAPYPNDLSDLARYFPQDTALYMAMHTDEAFLRHLDTTTTQIFDLFTTPTNVIAAPIRYTYQDETDPAYTPIRDTLDYFAEEIFGGTFDQSVRPWLGDTIALGVTDIDLLLRYSDLPFEQVYDAFQKQFPVIFAMHITDAAQARHILETPSPENRAIISAGDYTLYTLPDSVAGLLVTPDVLMFGEVDSLLNAIDRPVSMLADSADFQTVNSNLPADDYNALLYMSYDGLLQSLFLDVDTNEPPIEEALFRALTDFSGGVGIGATILPDNTFTLDYTQTNDITAIEQKLGLMMSVPFRANPNMAAYLPEQTAFAIFQTDLRQFYLSTLDNTRILSTLFPSPDMLTEDELEAALFLAQFWVQTNIGLNIENDILSWLDSDYVLAIAPSNDLTTARYWSQLRSSPIEALMLFDVTSAPDAAARTVTALTRSFDEQLETLASDFDAIGWDVMRTDETIAGVSLVRYAFDDVTEGIPFPIELFIGSNDEVLLLGTRDMVTTALDGSGTFHESATFTASQQGIVLSDAGLVMLANGGGIAPFSNLYQIWSQPNPYAEAEGNLLRAIASFFPRATISGHNSESGTTTLRLTLTIDAE